MSAVLLALAAGCGSTTREEPTVSSALAAGLPRVVAPPSAIFTRSIDVRTSLEGSIKLIDRCQGPVAIDLGSKNPVLVSQHDYCGGSDWISKLGVGDAVRLTGDGIEPGLYVASELRYQARLKAKVGDLPASDVVLQTCVTKEKLVLVGLEKFEHLTTG